MSYGHDYPDPFRLGPPLALRNGHHEPWIGSTPPPPEPADDEATADEDAIEARAVAREVAALRRRRDAQRLLDAETRPRLRRMGIDEFLAAPRPTPLVPGLLYRDSLSRIVGAPGACKSFVALDLALRVAAGLPWCDRPVERGRAFYVMAEGQAVNGDRTEAWLAHHGLDAARVRGWFDAFPDPVSLDEMGIAELAAVCASDRPALVVLDTKNAMMVGEENSATDSAVMRRALDVIRRSCDACVVLVDHTAKAGGEDGRGSNAVKAAMDTQIKVERADLADGGLITATVTRDKAAEAGTSWTFELRQAAPSAVVVPADALVETGPANALAWWSAHVAVPADLIEYKGPGAKAVPDLARFMLAEASSRHGDPSEVGATRVEAVAALRPDHPRTGVLRAWSALLARGDIEAAQGVKTPTGRHVWAR